MIMSVRKCSVISRLTKWSVLLWIWRRPELNIKPWEALRREINEENAMVNWMDRAPYAYWKGNPKVGAERLLLLRCNASGERDWNARVYAQVHSSLNAQVHVK
jgi:hypothetical protein